MKINEIINEGKNADPCWDNYKQVGMKKKNGKKVPNCVPKESVSEDKLNELFNQGKDWKWSFKGSEEAVAVFHVGEIPYQFYAYRPDDNYPGWDIEFKNAQRGKDRITKFGLTGTGNSAEVMSTVVDIMRSFLKEYNDKIKKLTFSAEEPSRQALYARMAKRLLPTWDLVQLGKNFSLRSPDEGSVTNEQLEETYHDDDEFFEAYSVMEYNDNMINESEYQGRKVTLNKPFRTSGGPKKFSVYVKNEKGNVVKVNFGDPKSKIKKHIPGRRANFRARHNCDSPGPKTSARYWSCRNW